MTVITVRIDGETRRLMERIRINWSEFIRSAMRRKIAEERGRISRRPSRSMRG